MLPCEVTHLSTSVSVQTADTVLVGRYQSAIDYLPALGLKAAQWSLYRQVSHVVEGPLYRGFRIEYCESPSAAQEKIGGDRKIHIDFSVQMVRFVCRRHASVPCPCGRQ